MGNNITKTKTEFDTSVINQTVTTILNTVLQNDKTRSTCQASEVVKITTLDIEGNCNVKFENFCKAYAKTISDLKTTLNVQVTDEQQSDITQDVMKQIAQKNAELNLFQSNAVEDSVEISNTIKNTIENTIKNEIQNIVGTYSEADSTFSFNVDIFKCKDNSTVTISNKAVAVALSDTITESVMNAIIGNSQLNSVLQKYDLTVKQTNQGINIAILALVAVFIFLLFTGGSLITKSMDIIKVLSPVLILFSISAVIYYEHNRNQTMAIGSLLIMWGLIITLLTASIKN